MLSFRDRDPAATTSGVAGVCSTCLCETKVFLLANTPQFLNICNGLTLKKEDKACIKCRARLSDMVNFRTTALKAQKKLAEMSQIPPKAPGRGCVKEKPNHANTPIKIQIHPSLASMEEELRAELRLGKIALYTEHKLKQEKGDHNYTDSKHGVNDQGKAAEKCRVKKEVLESSSKLQVPKALELKTDENEFNDYEALDDHSDDEMPAEQEISADEEIVVGEEIEVLHEISADQENPVDFETLITQTVLESQEMPDQDEVPEQESSNDITHIVILQEEPSGPIGRPKRPDSEMPYLKVKQIDRAEVVGFLARERKTDAYKRAPFKCDKCALTFRSVRCFENHNALHSEQRGELVCDICEQRFRKSPDLILHTAKHFTRYDCTHCSRVEYIRGRMEEHYKRRHDPSPRSCPKCSETFTSYVSMIAHIRRHHTRYQCEICSRIFHIAHTLRQHIKRRHTEVASVECNFCHRKYKGEHNLRAHIRLEHLRPKKDKVGERVTCDVCNLQFRDKYALKYHLNHDRRHIGLAASSHECDHCGKMFNWKRSLRRHIDRKHIKLPTHKCEICGEGFITDVFKNEHKREVHMGQPRKKHVCHTCGKSFAVRRTLTDHMNTHLGSRPYQCSLCGATFSYSAGLYNHNVWKHKDELDIPVKKER